MLNSWEKEVQIDLGKFGSATMSTTYNDGYEAIRAIDQVSTLSNERKILQIGQEMVKISKNVKHRMSIYSLSIIDQVYETPEAHSQCVRGEEAWLRVDLKQPLCFSVSIFM